MTDWLTSKEAASMLGFTANRVADLCREGVLEAKKVATKAKPSKGTYGGAWMIARRSVEDMLEEMQYEREMEANGMRRCKTCGDWKPLEAYWSRHRSCKDCVREKKRIAGKKGKEASSWVSSERNLGDGPVALAGGHWFKTAEPEDALKYACMDVGFHHRPCLPGRKRQLYCSKCTAKRCLHHPKLTPEEVCRLGRPPTNYPAISIHWLLQRSRGTLHQEEVRAEVESYVEVHDVRIAERAG